MRWVVVFLLIAVLLLGCVPQAGNVTEPPPTSRAVLTTVPLTDARVLPKEKRPNILFIITDDLDLELGTISYMPHLQELLVAQGLTLNDFFISLPLCCPARTTFLRGQYTHSHEVYRNDHPNGGFEEFYFLQRDSSTVATWLQAAGYRTVLLGKYLNGYPFPEDRAYVPAGWDEWYSAVKGSPFAGYRYTLNENGQQVDYEEKNQGESQYMTDVLGRKADEFIRRANTEHVPFFVYLSTYAPHIPVKPAPRHDELLPDLKVPRIRSFNEADVADKPDSIRYDPLLNDEQIAKMDEEYRGRVLTMQAVDEMIARLVDTLKETGQLENTYIIFTSDNGYHMGQHRLPAGKGTPYDEDIHVPFIIRGPGIESGTVLDGYITGNVDFAPTMAELAGVRPPEYVEGRSMVSLFGPARPPVSEWRSGYLLEFYGYNPNDEALDVPKPPVEYLGVRTQDYLYVERQDGFVELYDLRVDPYEMNNIAAVADKTLLSLFSEWLQALAQCTGSQCLILDKEPAR